MYAASPGHLRPGTGGKSAAQGQKGGGDYVTAQAIPKPGNTCGGRNGENMKRMSWMVKEMLGTELLREPIERQEASGCAVGCLRL